MADWLDRLEQEFRRKKAEERAEAERTASHEKFISDRGFDSWKELVARVASACERLSSGSAHRWFLRPTTMSVSVLWAELDC